jgi:hypothetical protein
MEPISVCSALFSMMIVGAYEFRPGMMLVEQFNFETNTTEELIVYTDDYLKCWEDGVPVREPRSTDRGGTSAPSNS